MQSVEFFYYYFSRGAPKSDEGVISQHVHGLPPFLPDWLTRPWSMSSWSCSEVILTWWPNLSCFLQARSERFIILLGTPLYNNRKAGDMEKHWITGFTQWSSGNVICPKHWNSNTTHSIRWQRGFTNGQIFVIVVTFLCRALDWNHADAIWTENTHTPTHVSIW